MDKGDQRLLLGTLANKSRLDILFSLIDGEKNVSDICKMLGLQQTLVSHSLKRLVAGGFVKVRKEGSFRYYALDRDFAEPFINVIDPTLRESVNEGLRVRAIITQAPLVLAVYNTNGIFTFVSGATGPRFGIMPQKMLGVSIFNVFKGDEVSIANYRRALSGETVYWTSVTHGHSFDVQASPYKDPFARIIGAIAISYDSSDRSKAERLLRRTIEDWRKLSEATPDLVAKIDQDGVFLLANREIAGVSREKVIGTMLRDYLPENLKKEVAKKLLSVVNAEEEEEEEAFTSSGFGKLKGVGLFECRIIPRKNRKGKIISLSFTARSVANGKRRG